MSMTAGLALALLAAAELPPPAPRLAQPPGAGMAPVAPLPPPAAPATPRMPTAAPAAARPALPHPHTVLYRLDQRLRALESDYRGLSPSQRRQRLDELGAMIALLRGRTLEPAVQKRLLGLEFWLGSEYDKLPHTLPVIPAAAPGPAP